MNREKATELVEQYVESWLTQDETLFFETLHDDVVVRECDGSVYEGMDACENWFRTWHAEDNRVLRWTINSFLFDPDATTAESSDARLAARRSLATAFEWDFECTVEGEDYTFFGSSHMTFRDGHIYSINEYERTKEQYCPQATNGQSQTDPDAL